MTFTVKKELLEGPNFNQTLAATRAKLIAGSNVKGKVGVLAQI
ncbi:MAG TPA: hypothetical protein VGJ48_24695 [Pyrinomonadaceae bacterium]|jgi:hypothetical protein